jgi:3-methyl-2-oxobutanoate hydroxymethyltransferase
VPAAVTEALMPSMELPVIGIGAGAGTDGQVLVFHDLLGIFGGHAPKFVKRYADVRGEMVAGVSAYADEVRSGAFPGPEHIYAIEPGELAEFRAYLDQEALTPDADWDWSATEI